MSESVVHFPSELAFVPKPSAAARRVRFAAAFLVVAVGAGRVEAKSTFREQLCKEGRLLVGAVVPPEERRASDKIYAAAIVTLKDAITIARQSSPCPVHLPFVDVDSYDQLILRAQMKKQIEQHGYLAGASMQSVLARTRQASFAGYVGLQVLSLPAGTAIQLSVYQPSDKPPGLTLARQKIVASDLGEAELLQLLSDLGKRLVDDTDQRPTARLRGPATLSTIPDHEVVLDATPSSDPDLGPPRMRDCVDHAHDRLCAAHRPQDDAYSRALDRPWRDGHHRRR